MKLICISDTHCLHKKINFESICSDAEIIVHCGDFTNNGSEQEVIYFLDWYKSLPFKHKILVPGNHDWFFEENSREARQLCLDRQIILLNDSSCTINNIKFWGCPVTPAFFDWAFNKNKEEIIWHWDIIPNDINVLITHGPPSNILSFNESKVDCGCVSLRKKIEKINPKYHIFGHIHESYGIYKNEKTTFINCSLKNFPTLNIPIEIEI